MQQFHPHPYQQAGIDAILEKPGVALWMEMGLGKTVVTLTAIDQLIYDRLEISRVLIVARRRSQKRRGRTKPPSGGTCSTCAFPPCWAQRSSARQLWQPRQIFTSSTARTSPGWFTHWPGLEL